MTISSAAAPELEAPGSGSLAATVATLKAAAHAGAAEGVFLYTITGTSIHTAVRSQLDLYDEGYRFCGFDPRYRTLRMRRPA